MGINRDGGSIVMGIDHDVGLIMMGMKCNGDQLCKCTKGINQDEDQL